jgi:endonuclease YncB( thermonuclease family)
VVGVSDGDTITILDSGNRQHKIRLEGIDAPESNQGYGSRAKQCLSDLVFGKTVTVTI